MFSKSFRIKKLKLWAEQPTSHLVFNVFVSLQGTLVETLKEARPTLFLGVPRVYEKIQEKMVAMGKNLSGIQKKIGSWAKDIGLRGNLALMKGCVPVNKQYLIR